MLNTVINKPAPLLSAELPAKFGYPKSRRLLCKADFDPIFKDAPIRVSNNSFLILSRMNPSIGPRLGLIIAKKHVRRAVDRNRIKRAVRETFRLQQKNLPPIDVIVLARRGSDQIPPGELTNTLNTLWKRIIKRAQQHTD